MNMNLFTLNEQKRREIRARMTRRPVRRVHPWTTAQERCNASGRASGLADVGDAEQLARSPVRHASLPDDIATRALFPASDGAGATGLLEDGGVAW